MSSCLSCGGEVGAGMTCSHHKDQHYCSYKCALKHPCFESVGTRAIYEQFVMARDALHKDLDTSYHYVVLYDQNDPEDSDDLCDILFSLLNDNRTVRMLFQKEDISWMHEMEKYVKSLVHLYGFEWRFTLNDFPYILHEILTTYDYTTTREDRHGKDRDTKTAIMGLYNKEIPFITMQKQYKGISRDAVIVYNDQGSQSTIDIEFDKKDIPKNLPSWLKRDKDHESLFYTKKASSQDLYFQMTRNYQYKDNKIINI